MGQSAWSKSHVYRVLGTVYMQELVSCMRSFAGMVTGRIHSPPSVQPLPRNFLSTARNCGSAAAIRRSSFVRISSAVSADGG